MSQGIQVLMRKVQVQVREKLKAITVIDSQVYLKKAIYQILTSKYLSLSQKTDKTSEDDQNLAKIMEEIRLIEIYIRHGNQKKVMISRQLYIQVSNFGEEFDQLFEQQMKNDFNGNYKEEEKFYAEALANEENTLIFLQAHNEEMMEYCKCRGECKSTEMIKCDGRECKTRWYHFSCIGMQETAIPQTWLCPDCLT